MNKILLLLIFISCAHAPKNAPPPDGLVRVETAIESSRSSYLKGCVDAHHDLGIPSVFEYCRGKADLHKAELLQIMEQDP